MTSLTWETVLIHTFAQNKITLINIRGKKTISFFMNWMVLICLMFEFSSSKSFWCVFFCVFFFWPILVEISWNSPSGFGEENFQFFVNDFIAISLLSSLENRHAWPFIWSKLIFLHTRLLCAKFGWKWPINRF